MEQIICLRNGRRYWYTFGKQHTVHTCMYKQEIGENKGKWSVLQAMTEYISLLNSLLSYYICCIQSKQLNLKLKKEELKELEAQLLTFFLSTLHYVEQYVLVILLNVCPALLKRQIWLSGMASRKPENTQSAEANQSSNSTLPFMSTPICANIWVPLWGFFWLETILGKVNCEPTFLLMIISRHSQAGIFRTSLSNSKQRICRSMQSCANRTSNLIHPRNPFNVSRVCSANLWWTRACNTNRIWSMFNN